MSPFDWDLPWAKPALALGALALALIAGAGYQRHQVVAARAEARVFQEVASGAKQREDTATAKAAAHATQAADWRRKHDEIKRQMEALPRDPGPRPVSPTAGALEIAGALREMGLNPQLLGDPLALGLTLPDSRTATNWGREAQRVGPLTARLEVAIALARSQEGLAGSLTSQVEHLTDALGACDDRAAAEQRRGDALDRGLRAQGKPRNWTAGALVGLDLEGRKHLGAYVSWSYKAVDLHAVFINNTAAVGGGIRF